MKIANPGLICAYCLTFLFFYNGVSETAQNDTIQPGVWTMDYDGALKLAEKEKLPLLLNFTGSDWCGWCKKLDAEVFSKKEFTEYAEKNLVLVELDFPAKKKQSAELKEANSKLKDKYKVSGFPTILAIDGDGKVCWTQVGYLAGGPSVFIGKLNDAKSKAEK